MMFDCKVADGKVGIEIGADGALSLTIEGASVHLTKDQVTAVISALASATLVQEAMIKATAQASMRLR